MRKKQHEQRASAGRPEAAISRIVDWVHAGKPASEPTDAMSEFVRWARETGWDGTDLVWPAGTVIPADLEPDWDYSDHLEGRLEGPLPHRITDLIEQGKPVPVEDRPLVAEAFRRFLARNPDVALDYYDSQCPSLGVAEVKDVNGRSVYFVRCATGFAFSTEEWIEGYYARFEEAETAIRRSGIVADDLR